ncbi:NADPH-dependent F420 reductase [Nissabacter archeti]|uniref:NADPH-dependent F420 reductase n=1 Tax=Nissabacter archeti TaxID=1917880 RepID=UPI0023EA6639|nr:NAD(P)-binding domain-containing protein [Nissabacter archeti]
MRKMKISVIGAGNIGSTLARSLARAGHTVTLANSRGPETIQKLADDLGVAAAAAADAVKQAEVIVLSIPFAAMPTLADVLRMAPPSAIIVDMSNNYPSGSGIEDGADGSTSDSGWVSQKLGRPVIKAWNSIFSRSLALKGRPRGEPDRIALPVAGDDEACKRVIMQLVEDTGFDAIDAGDLSASWRMQPGSPAYCTDLDAATLRRALASADRSRLPEDRYAQVSRVYKPNAGAEGAGAVDMVNGPQLYREVTPIRE